MPKKKKTTLGEKDIYSKKKTYADKIEPIIHDLKIACNVHRMPMFVCVAVENKEEGTVYANDMVLASTQTTLKQNALSNLLLYLNGFDLDHPEYIKKNIKELEEYLKKIQIQSKEALGISLKEDRIPHMYQIVNGEKTATLPKEFTHKEITDEFLDD